MTPLGTEGSPETPQVFQIIITNTKDTIRPGTGLIWVKSAALSVRGRYMKFETKQVPETSETEEKQKINTLEGGQSFPDSFSAS